ncbi:MAG: triose-phosphate isomerase [Vampirovibrionales bacterium]|nr:triose-phosphate isomerase [Vampirovibrionales bacterium]
MPRKPLIAANWKLAKTLTEAKSYLDAFKPELSAQQIDLSQIEVLLAPTSLVLGALVGQAMASGAEADGCPFKRMLAAQNLAAQPEGAYTGEVSAKMVADLGLGYAIIGHSERRSLFGDTDDIVAEKVKRALEAGVAPILCVGETLEQREAGQTDAVIRQQLKIAINSSVEAINAGKNALVIAYEPVWAIGTGQTCDAIEADRVCGMIRGELTQLLGEATANTTRIQYGGSVKPENALELMQQPEIDGALVGGASLDPVSFVKIVAAAQQALALKAQCPVAV